MATDTPLSYRNLVIYEVYVRNHGPNGTFADVIADLPRLKAMGVDVVWFMPIHPIGMANKKGSLGCPYSIQDYRGVNPEYGSRQDFAELIAAAHALGLKVMIDVVYNHTAHDAVLLEQHPEWYHTGPDGRPVTTVPDWSDVIDLKYPGNPGLWEYQIETLKIWAQLGVDGFRCDVAPLLPLEFWLQARRAVALVKPGVIWLAETVHTAFVIYRRENGLPTLSDGEMMAAFDMVYDYDIWVAWQKAALDPALVPVYLDLVRMQKGIYPAHGFKLRYVENHDQDRVMRHVPDRRRALAWTAFAAFNEGPFLIYAGQESECTHTPSLFDIDKIDWGNYSLQPFLTALCEIKKSDECENGLFRILHATPIATACWQTEIGDLYGIFNLSGYRGWVQAALPDGDYLDLISRQTVNLAAGRLEAPESALVLRYKGHIDSSQPAQETVIL